MENVKQVLDRVAANYNKMGSALVAARGSFVSIELRTAPSAIADDTGEATAAIARSAIRSIDDCMISLEAL